MRIEFSARAWVLSAAAGLVILPSMDVGSQAEDQTTGSPVLDSSGEPRKLIERPATREAISTSRPARSLFPKLFAGKKAEPSPQLPPKEPGDTRSDVQRHLEELYRKNGRKAPSMELGQPLNTGLTQSNPQLPKRSASNAKSNVAEANSSAGKTSGSSPIRQVSSNPLKRFFQKITPFRRPKNVNDERPKHVEPLPAAARQEQLRLQQAPIAPPVSKPKPAAKPNLEPMPIPISDNGAKARPALPALDMLVPPAPAPFKANTASVPAADLPSEPTVATKTDSESSTERLPEFLPAVEAAPKILAAGLSDEPIGSKEEKGESVSASPDSDELLGNPFPELSESAADGTAKADKASKVAQPAAVAEKKDDKESNPFSGLKLSAESVVDAEAKAAADLGSDVQQTAADSLLLPPLPELPAPAELAAPKDAAPAGKLPEITPAEKPASNGAHRDKLQQIAERSELTGLKGFCPVALRDQRELKDARPQFQAAFNGRNYNLSSAEAKAKFESDPEAYAPAAAGQDVVLAASEGAEREGSLDRAVWYRNRLYLFSSRDSHEEFVASPSKFAVDIADADSDDK